MEFTIHGLERIYDRTKMRPEDVLSIIAEKATVYLGSADDYEYHLFYSPPDRDTRIAVISKAERKLISVWKKAYFLPPGLQTIDWITEQRARSVLHEFVFSRIKKEGQSAIPREHGAEPRAQVTINVRRSLTSEYSRDIGEISVEDTMKFEKELLAVLMPQLSPIAQAVEEVLGTESGAVRYDIFLTRSDRPTDPRRITVKHETVMKLVPHPPE